MFDVFRKKEVGKKEAWSYSELRDAIVSSCRDGEPGVVSFDHLPSRVELGKLGEKATECLSYTDQDGDGRERLAQFVWEPKHERLLVSRRDRLKIGSEKSVAADFSPMVSSDKSTDGSFGSLMRTVQNAAQDLFSGYTPDSSFGESTKLIGTAHSHPDYSPFSPQDILHMLGSDDMRVITLASRGGRLRSLLATKETVRFQQDELSMGRVEDFENRVIDLMRKNINTRFKRYTKEHGKIYLESVYNLLVEASLDAVVAHVAEERKLGYYVQDKETKEMRRLRLKK